MWYNVTLIIEQDKVDFYFEGQLAATRAVGRRSDTYYGIGVINGWKNTAKVKGLASPGTVHSFLIIYFDVSHSCC